jgi:hypothetical protein
VTGEPDHHLDTGVAHIARVYNYWLGGTDNFAADRAAADAAVAAHPGLLTDARANRAFLGRAVRFLAAEAGVRQFLDIGTGIPAAGNTHEVAQAHEPGCRVVYVDNDPMVLARARGLPPGITMYLDADLRDPDRILTGAAALLDFTRPVAILLVAVLHLISDEDDPYGIVRRLAGAAAPGSYLTISHVPSDMQTTAMAALGARMNELIPQRSTYRTHAEISRFFSGLDLVPPGIVPVHQWHPDPSPEPPVPAAVWGAVARKP